MYNITAIVPRGQGIGFTYAGIQIREVASINDAHTVLAEEIEDAHNGIILVDEAFNKIYPRNSRKKSMKAPYRSLSTSRLLRNGNMSINVMKFLKELSIAQSDIV